MLSYLRLWGPPHFKIRIIYSGGHVQDFWCLKFTINDDMFYRFHAVGDVHPLKIAVRVEDIQGIYRVSYRRSLINIIFPRLYE